MRLGASAPFLFIPSDSDGPELGKQGSGKFPWDSHGPEEGKAGQGLAESDGGVHGGR